MPQFELQRRQFISALGAGAALPLFSWPLSSAAESVVNSLGESVSVDVAPEIHLLKRCSFGLTPESVARIRQIGRAAYIEEQLNWQAFDDSAVNNHVQTQHPQTALTDCKLLVAEPMATGNALIDARLVRAVHSKAQLHEMMVEFWTDHFNINLLHSDYVKKLKIKDDRDVIRHHALGSFRDLLGASMLSPAMLIYLDNSNSIAKTPVDNYARELLELHTLGVDGGYTEQDVKEVARCLTGWSVAVDPKAWSCGYDAGFQYYDFLHDQGSKTVLGHNIPAGGGMQDGLLLRDILVAHPSTAKFIAGKLCRFFISETPSASTVNAVAAAYGADGDIKGMLRALLNSAEFNSARGNLYRRPFHFVAAALRSLQLPAGHSLQAAARYTTEISGHGCYQWVTPDGYPWQAAYWHTPYGAITRWMFSMLSGINLIQDGSLMNLAPVMNTSTVNGVVAGLSEQILGHSLPDNQHQALSSFVSQGQNPDAPANLQQRVIAAAYTVALLLSSAHFQAN